MVSCSLRLTWKRSPNHVSSTVPCEGITPLAAVANLYPEGDKLSRNRMPRRAHKETGGSDDLEEPLPASRLLSGSRAGGQAQDKAEPGGQGLGPGSGVRDTPPLPSHRDTPPPSGGRAGPFSTPPEQRRHQKRLKIQPLEGSGSPSLRGLGSVVTGHAAARLTCPCRAGGQECPSRQRDTSGRFAKCWAVPGPRAPLRWSVSWHGQGHRITPWAVCSRPRAEGRGPLCGEVGFLEQEEPSREGWAPSESASERLLHRPGREPELWTWLVRRGTFPGSRAPPCGSSRVSSTAPRAHPLEVVRREGVPERGLHRPSSASHQRPLPGCALAAAGQQGLGGDPGPARGLPLNSEPNKPCPMGFPPNAFPVPCKEAPGPLDSREDCESPSRPLRRVEENEVRTPYPGWEPSTQGGNPLPRRGCGEDATPPPCAQRRSPGGPLGR
ncbi:unnamed protein product, partial [Rangifer tarandus platyrhynchus]